MITNPEQALTQASMYHQQFIEMVANKGQFSPGEAAKCVEAAESLYIEILNQDMDWEVALYQLATLYMQTNRNVLAVKLLEPLAQKREAKLEVLNNLGAAYRNEHKNEQARKWFMEGLKIQRHPDLLANLTALWVNEGYPEKGIPFGRECLALDPSHKQGRWNLGLLLLENKEYEEGFNLYQQGFKTGERIVRPYLNKDGKEAEFWEGQDLKGKSIVLHGEQGVGDELLFLQFVPEFIKEHPDTHLVLDVHPRLCSMIQRSFPEISDIFPTRKTKPEWNESIRVDYKDGLGSLPKYYHSARRKNVGWLKPDEYLTGCYQDVIKEIQKTCGQEGKPVIGIAWSGGKKKTRVDLRSIPLPKWRPLLEQDATFISLEYWPDAEQETSKLLKNHGIYLHHWPDVTEDPDYEHTVALASACDLVICVNTSIVHVRGSMDRPCWTLTPHGHAWRYGKKDVINPFYNSVKQYHQGEGQEWESVIKVVEKDLKRFIRSFT